MESLAFPCCWERRGCRERRSFRLRLLGFAIQAKRLKEEFERSGELRRQLQEYLLANLIQSAQNAACSRMHTIGERLSRWLLTCHDRVQSDRMPMGLCAKSFSVWVFCSAVLDRLIS